MDWRSKRIAKVEVTNGDVREVLRSLFAGTGVSYLVDPEVTGKITANLTDVELGTVLPPLLRLANATFRADRDVLTILPLSSSLPILGDNGVMTEVSIYDIELAEAVKKLPLAKPVSISPGVGGIVALSASSLTPRDVLERLAAQVDAKVTESEDMFVLVPKRSLQKPLSGLRKTDADVRQLILELLSTTGVNFLISGGIAGRTTLQLGETDVHTALEAILAPLGGHIRIHRGIFIISAR